MGNDNKQIRTRTERGTIRGRKAKRPTQAVGFAPNVKPNVTSVPSGVAERLSPFFVPSDVATWPPQIQVLPRDPHGRPITYVTYYDTSVDPPIVDFRVTDMGRRMECYRNRLCGVCGQPLGYFITFVGGPYSASERWYVDPAMHEACADFSIAVCPHLSRYKARFSNRPFHPDLVVTGRIEMVKAPYIVKYITRDYKIGHGPSGDYMVYASPAKQLITIPYPDAPILQGEPSVPSNDL